MYVVQDEKSIIGFNYTLYRITDIVELHRNHLQDQ